MKNNTNEAMTEMNLGILNVNDAELRDNLEKIRAEYDATISRLKQETLKAIGAHVEGIQVLMRDARHAKRANTIKNAKDIFGNVVQVELENGNLAKIVLK